MADAHLLQQLLVQIHSQKLSDEKTIKSLLSERQSLGSELTATQSELEALDQKAAKLTRQIANLNQSVTTENFSEEDFTSAVVEPLKERCEKLEVKVSASLVSSIAVWGKMSRAVSEDEVGQSSSNVVCGVFALPLPFTERVMRRLVDSLGSESASLESSAQKPCLLLDTCTEAIKPIASSPPCRGGPSSCQMQKFIGLRASELTGRDELLELYEAAVSLAKLSSDSSPALSVGDDDECGAASSRISSEYWCDCGGSDDRFTLEDNAVNQTQGSAFSLPRTYCQSCERCVIAAVEDRIESLIDFIDRQTQNHQRMHLSLAFSKEQEKAPDASARVSRQVEGDGKAFSIPLNGQYGRQVDSPQYSSALLPPSNLGHGETSHYPNQYGLAFSRARKSITPILANAADPENSSSATAYSAPKTHRPRSGMMTIYNPYLGHKRPQSHSQPQEESEEYIYDASSFAKLRGIVSSHNDSQNSTERGLGNAKKPADGRQSRGRRQSDLEIGGVTKNGGRKQTNKPTYLSSLSSFFVSDEFDDAFVPARIAGVCSFGEDCDEGQRALLDEHSDLNHYDHVSREVHDRHRSDINTISLQEPACVLTTQLPPPQTARAATREHDPIVTAVSAFPHRSRGERVSGETFVGRGQHALLFGAGDILKDGRLSTQEKIVSAPSHVAAFPAQMSASTQIRSAFAPRGRAKKTTLQFGR